MKKNLIFTLALCAFVLRPLSLWSYDTTSYPFYAAFASDRHSQPEAFAAAFDGAKTLPVGYVCMVGDMEGTKGTDVPVYKSSAIQTEVRNVFADASVQIVCGNHDANVNDDAGIVYGLNASGLAYTQRDVAGNVVYYVYAVAYGDMDEEDTAARQAAEAFKTWAATIADPTIPIIVTTHLPLHAKRGDNGGAAVWNNALNAVATGSASGTEVARDLIVLHGHNHTTESTEYHYSPGETMNVQGAGTCSIYYTYLTAGYLKIGPNGTVVTISEDKITMTKYNSGVKGSVYTVDRVVMPEPHTMTWMCGAETFATTTVTTARLTFPTESPVLEGYTFVGWTTAESVSADGAGLVLAAAGDAVKADQTYRAVFAHETSTSGAAVGDVLWGETFDHCSGTSALTQYGVGTGTTVWGQGAVSYSTTGTVKATQSVSSSSMKAPALSITSGGSWTITGIPTGGATALAMTFKTNKSSFKLTSATQGVTVSGSSSSWTVKVPEGVKTIDLTLSYTSSSGSTSAATCDNFSLKATAAPGTIVTYDSYTMGGEGDDEGDGDGQYCPCGCGCLIGDVNRDGVVDVSDITELVNIILHSGAQQ